MGENRTPVIAIVGGGVMGALVAARVREGAPDARIVMYDAGAAIGAGVGVHLHDDPDPEVRRAFARLAYAGNQAAYVDHDKGDPGDRDRGVPRGMRYLSDFGHDSSEMPGASIGWNAGGMSVHWAAAAPTPYGAEIPSEIPRAEWEEDLAEAQRRLSVRSGVYGEDRTGDRVVELLRAEFDRTSAPGRHVQDMPLAMTRDGRRRLVRTGPATVFPAIDSGGDGLFDYRQSTLCRLVLTEDERVTGVVVHDLCDGSEREERADAVVVCADTMRTPQLLAASGLGGPANGRYLNEHAFVAGRVVVDRERIGAPEMPTALPDESFTSMTWLPHSGESQPFQGQIAQGPFAEDTGRRGYAVTLALYVPTDVRAENRIEFSEQDTDVFGLPRMSVRFGYTAADRDRIARAVDVQAHAAAGIGELASEVLPAGSSLHYTGTARMGGSADGRSVCDGEGRVWGVRGLFVAGNAVIPTALVANSTLAGAVTAVRAGRAVVADLRERIVSRGRHALP